MYYLMNKDFAQPLLADFPNAISYDSGKVRLTGQAPVGFSGDVENIYSELLTGEDLTIRFDGYLNGTPNGTMAILSNSQGRWLYDNHDAFNQ